MRTKSLIISMVLLFSLTLTLTATVPFWNIDSLGIPNPLPSAPAIGFQLTLSPPGGAVATNGTVYAIGFDAENVYLACWSFCSGWGGIATFGLPATLSQVAGPAALCLDGHGNLYVGGDFCSVTQWPDGPTVNATNIAVYNLQSGLWSGIGNALLDFDTNTVTAIAVDTNQKVYIGTYPQFNLTYPWLPISSTNIFMVYSNSQWVSVGGSMLVYQGYTEGFPIDAMVANGKDIYLAGDLLGATNHLTNFVSSTNIIKWNGESNIWQTMGAGSVIWGTNVDTHGYDAQIYALAVSGSNVFIAGGWYSGMGEDWQPGPGYGVGIFSTNGTWLGLSASPGLYNSGCGYQNGLALAVQNGNVYLGGDFEYTGTCSGTAANGIAVWTNSEWQPLASGGVQNWDGSYSTGTVNWLAADANAVYVLGSFSFAGGLPTTNAARYVTKSVTSTTLDPCQTTWPLIVINLEGIGNPPMEGPAAFGFTSSDYWNLFDQALKCISQPYTNISKLTNVLGYQTSIGISIDGEGHSGYGSGTTSGSTIRLLTNFCNANCESYPIVITITNLPSVESNGLSGLYNVYVYGYGGTATIMHIEYSLNAQFSISPSGTNVYGATVTTLATSSDIYDINTWTENNQYVVFPNVPISPGTKLEITVAPDPANPAGDWSINGIQIVPYPYYP